MEFLLQMIAELLSNPEEIQQQQINNVVDEVEVEEVVAEEEFFSLMHFH
ncbi:hypothetical protein [Plebeiibacterium marinum]|uniref:Uncharacterized protein n=1 Tax=Plebeiibacterium marinum TaxID=2992111 RepID=A0AAE3MCZ6_9BACT|nr:hypothetical protein [Plebeiobacterium marinum]MCW3804782.1 hypothetical protein [Plebeiobacterium marinum]